MKINFFRKRFLIPIFVLAGISIYLWWGIFLPLDRDDGTETVFEIKRGEGSFQIAQNLEEEDIIKNNLLFSFYVLLTGNQRKLQSGTYYFSASESVSDIAGKIVRGKTAQLKVTVPEGFSMEQIEKRLVENGFVEALELKSLKVKDFKDQFDFLKDVPSDKNLEGFLFPETYIFSYNKSIREIAEIMLNVFNEKVFLPFKEEFEDQDIFETVIMASLIEKEVISLEDKKKISDILWRRLKISMPLQVDATISYLTGKRTVRIPLKDLEIDSPYNTYKYSGLPVGPISNPGLESILSSLYPKDNNYWYYLSTPEGETKFSKTLQEHNRYKNIYLR